MDVKKDIELQKIPSHHSGSPFHCLYTPQIFLGMESVGQYIAITLQMTDHQHLEGGLKNSTQSHKSNKHHNFELIFQVQKCSGYEGSSI